MCHGLGYNLVRMPNFVDHQALQKDAGENIKVFHPLVATNCSPILRSFLCLLYFPPCVINNNTNMIMKWKWKMEPCRDVCEEARRGCEPVLLALGFRWPEIMKCEEYPTFDKIKFKCLRPKIKPSTPTEITPLQSRCLPLKIPMCRSLNYTRTILPNFLNHTSQSQVKQIMNSKAFQSHLRSQCSQHLTRFVCFLFAPYCTSDGTALPPCRSFCDKVKTDCANVSARWLADLNCARFPTLSRRRLCFGDPLTTMDCIGPHSRPCKVISSTFPIILKCSSPGINFSIDEISINLYNRTNVLVTSTSDALRQCNQSREQAEGRHECQFIVKYGEFGIDTMSVMTNQDRSLGIHFHLALLIVIIIIRQQSADCNVCQDSFPVFDHALSGHVIKTVTKDSFDRCIFSCELDSQCYSVNFHAKGKLCEFNLGTMEEFEADFVQRKETIYINMVVRRFDRCTLAESCRNGGSCEPHPVTHCLCPEGFSGSLCEVSVPVPLGFESGELKDVHLSASTIKDGHEAWRASLRGANCWMPQYDNTPQYFTVFLSDIKVKLSAIATQGAVYEACWITAYTLHVSHGGKWNWYKENGVVKTFIGNKDKSSVVKHELKPFEVSVIRLHPKTWNHCIALRMELYGTRL
ncbi:hypothetical protein OS493_031261 [Desmophyllum pertusum]|uniref:F5/8 type C domain-containing protein n=1 Tax=Desmophyllum pertusum TaxID=174260 RepID=A0A9W9ZBG8_9CNID|nr:hypothetical protein OS493_031261 [Desmophyllum pertusum]